MYLRNTNTCRERTPNPFFTDQKNKNKKASPQECKKCVHIFEIGNEPFFTDGKKKKSIRRPTTLEKERKSGFKTPILTRKQAFTVNHTEKGTQSGFEISQ